MQGIICKNCGNKFSGKYCNHCGEKVYTDHDKSIRHFIEEGFHFFTHLDGTFLRTLKYLFTRPGFVSAEITEGRRKRYYKPISLFIIAIIIYLLFPTLRGLNLKMEDQFTFLQHMNLGFIERLAESKASAQGISVETLQEKYDHKSSAIAKILLLIIIPLCAGSIKLLFPRKRRFFFDYMIMATESVNFLIYFSFLLLPLVLSILFTLAKLLKLVDNSGFNDDLLSPITMIGLIIWNTIAFRRFFKSGGFVSFLKALAYLFLQSVVIFIIYRLILFLIVLLFI